MITRDQASTLISIIDKMQDLELKQEFLQQLKTFLGEEEKLKDKVPRIELKDILQGFKTLCVRVSHNLRIWPI